MIHECDMSARLRAIGLKPTAAQSVTIDRDQSTDILYVHVSIHLNMQTHI